MAKIKHNSSFDTFKTIINDAKARGLVQLQDESSNFDGKTYQIGDKSLLNFGYCGYLGLEMHPALKAGAIEQIEKNGLQYGVSRAYITSKPEQTLLELLGKMFHNLPVIINSSTSSSHIGNIPNIVSSDDAIIFDQQVHFSVQTGAQLCRQQGVPIEMIRHNNLEMLERQYHQLKHQHKRIWYMLDGVYSMYGDTAPFEELRELLNRLPQLHLYVDDAHGMSWDGQNGCGHFFHHFGYHERLVLNVTMGKAFGVTGGVTVFPTQEFYDKVKVFGGPLTYSHPLSPAITGAAIASCKLHLSDEFSSIQKDLSDKIFHCQQALDQTNLPILSNPHTPIFFVGMGQPKVAYSMVRRIIDEGFYVNTALFPAVSVKCSGIRFSISRHNEKQDISQLVDALAYHYPKALEENDTTNAKVRRAFKLPAVEEEQIAPKQSSQKWRIEWRNTIQDIDQASWDKVHADKGSFNWKGMRFLEAVFANNIQPKHQWDFYYLNLYSGDDLVLSTFFTHATVKEDLFAEASISAQIEKQRRKEPDYLVSTALMMGCLLTEGQHLYLNTQHAKAQEAVEQMLKEVDLLQDKIGANMVWLRDFDKSTNLDGFFLENGYVSFDMPNANILHLKPFNSIDEFLPSISKKSRRHFRADVLPYVDKFKVVVDDEMGHDLINHCHQLMVNIASKNLSVNLYPYPINLLNEIAIDPNWEIINLYVEESILPVASIWSYKGESYCPMLMGMDYTFLESHKLYKQALFRIVERASQLQYDKIYFGFSADLEKHKMGAEAFPKKAYVRTNDNFGFELMSSMSKAQEEFAMS